MTTLVPCCANQATHKTCPDGKHQWETQTLNQGQEFEHQADRCKVCHINRVAVDEESRPA